MFFNKQSKDEQSMFADKEKGYGYVNLDMSMFNETNNELDINPVLNKLLNKCMHELFSNSDSNAAINNVLKYVGTGMNLSRSYVFIKEMNGRYVKTNAWQSTDIEVSGDIQHLPVAPMSSQLITQMKRNGLLVASDIRLLENGGPETLNWYGPKSIVEFPIYKNNELNGIVGFDYCIDVYEWKQEDIHILHTIASIIISVLSQIWLREEVYNQNIRLESLLNSIDVAIHVTDLYTNEILFVNSSMSKLYPNKQLIGLPCWKVFFDRNMKCDFCPIPFLLENPDKAYRWEMYNDVVKGYFRLQGNIIPWTGNKLVHLEYADDITEIKEIQNKLEILATTDMRTLTLNRSSFNDALVKLLNEANQKNNHITIAFIDIDGLKKVNDSYGHISGDELINDVVKVLRKNIRETDIIGRYGGDEFVIAFVGLTRATVENKIKRSLDMFGEIAQEKNHYYESGFSYGIVENTEIPYENSDDFMNQLISMADDRMFENKNTRYSA